MGLLVALAGCQVSSDRAPPSSTDAGLQRLISLSPGITETIAALGAHDRLVAVSEFCRRPISVCDRPRVGHALRPDLEGIAKLRPDLVVYEATQAGPGADLSALGPIEVLPWLTLPEIAASIRRLGRLLDAMPRADALAGRLEGRLGRSPNPEGPEVLLILGYPEASGTFWFIKPESLHGRLVPAAGGRHPPKLVGWTGPPKITAEGLVRLNPEWIVVLSRDERSAGLEPLLRLTPLRAVREGRLRRLIDPDVLSTGPSILKQIDQLANRLREASAR